MRVTATIIRPLFTLILCLESAPAFPQENVGVDSLGVGRLGIVVDALAFFRDNEYTSDMTTGYTLPGAWLRPTIQYNPNSSIHLEAGAHALFYNGANKYPNYVYHDVATWKGNQYQDGCHLLPWLRAQASLPGVKFVLGDIYGGDFHDYILPLYNPEQMLSADPEAGAQIIVDYKRFHGDLYINWQSYQFEEDTHQEAFTVGLSTRLDLDKRRELAATLSMIIHHRGGEQDNTDAGVQTIANASLGVDYRHQRAGVINACGAQANVLLARQMSGSLWPFDTGFAVHAEGSMELFHQLSLRAGYFYAPSDFVSLLGSPFFSTVSVKHDDLVLDGVGTGYIMADYHRTFAGNYTLGANVEAYQVNSSGLGEFNFSFGIYLHVCPWFKL